MDKYIAAKDDTRKVRKLLLSFKDDHMPELRREAAKGNEKVAQVISIIISGMRYSKSCDISSSSMSQLPAAKWTGVISLIYKLAVEFLNYENVGEPFLNRVHSVLQLDGSVLDEETLAGFVKHYLKLLGTGAYMTKQSMELFGTLVRIIHAKDCIEWNSIDTKGPECQQAIVKEVIYDTDWVKNPLMVVSAVAEFDQLQSRDFEEITSQASKVYSDIFMKDTTRIKEITEVTNFLLKIAVKGNCIGLMIDNILTWFRALDDKYWAR